MSDYMFMLENHLNNEQSRVVSELQSICAASNTNVFLTGGAMRDMLGGFPIRDLDFSLETNAIKIARELAPKLGAEIISTDENRKTAELLLPSGATFSLGMTRQEKYARTGGKPQVTPASIHEDLRRRDFTVNAIALSLGRASKGLLFDPTNGLSDIERRELRAVHNYIFYDDPVRLWRLVRLRIRLGFEVDERTANQSRNARESEAEKHIAPRALFEQFRQIANESNIAEILKALEEDGLIQQVSPAFAGAKLNLPGFVKLLRARQLYPFGLDWKVNNLLLFLDLLGEKLTPRERAAMFKAIAAEKSELDALAKLGARARRLESQLKSAKLQKASQVYEAIAEQAGEVVLYLLTHTSQRIVQDRIKNYFQKYMLAAAEITDREIETEGLVPGTPKFAKRKAEKIAARLDGRVRKPAPPIAAPEMEPAPTARVSAIAANRATAAAASRRIL